MAYQKSRALHNHPGGNGPSQQSGVFVVTRNEKPDYQKKRRFVVTARRKVANKKSG